MSLSIQIHGESISLIREYPENGDQFVLLIEGVEVTLWNRAAIRDALLPVIEIHPDYKCYTSAGTLTNYAAAQYYKALRLKGKSEVIAAEAAVIYNVELDNMAKLDAEPYEVIQCPDDCPCHTDAPIEFEPDPDNLGYPYEEPPESSNDDPRIYGPDEDKTDEILQKVWSRDLTEEEWDRRERGYLDPKYRAHQD